jgi:pimeloyl-ACP methyl ester carboxylesterase
MTRRPLVLIHGYSDTGTSFRHWAETLRLAGEDATDVTVIHACNYATLTNEVTVKDVAEGFDRALRIQAGLDKGEEFDAIVHSTGMLVVRAWLTTYTQSARQGRLKHLIALAPATFGSPLARKGRSWLGAIFKGNRQLGPDFLEAGDDILDALELASPFTWDLAHKDLLTEHPFYGPDSTTPYVFIFCGTDRYGPLADFVTEEVGTDGTVRWAGCPLNTRKILIDLSVDDLMLEQQRVTIGPWSNLDSPFIPISGKNHGTILREPPDELIDLIRKALAVADQASYERWCTEAQARTQTIRNSIEQWQQFIVHVVDERGDSVPDYYIQLFIEEEGTERKLHEFAMDVDTYSKDSSFRCYHVSLTQLKDKINLEQPQNLWLRIMATTGSTLIGYTGWGAEGMLHRGTTANAPGEWDAKLRIPKKITGNFGQEIGFFYPFTTTLVEVKINREPFPFNPADSNKLVTLAPFFNND